VNVLEMGNLALLVAADIDRAGLPDPAAIDVQGYLDTVQVYFGGRDAVSTDALADRHGLSMIAEGDPYHAPTLRTWRGKVELGGLSVIMQVYCGVSTDER
jgi:hypothetical protein